MTERLGNQQKTIRLIGLLHFFVSEDHFIQLFHVMLFFIWKDIFVRPLEAALIHRTRVQYVRAVASTFWALEC